MCWLKLNLDSSPAVSGRIVRSTFDIKLVEEPGFRDRRTTSPDGGIELSTHIELNTYIISRPHPEPTLTAFVDRSPWRLWLKVQVPAIANGFTNIRTLCKSPYGPLLAFDALDVEWNLNQYSWLVRDALLAMGSSGVHFISTYNIKVDM